MGTKRDRHAEIRGAPKQKEKKKTKTVPQSPPKFTDKKASAPAKFKSILGKYSPLQIIVESKPLVTPKPKSASKPVEEKIAIPEKKGRALATVHKYSYTVPDKTSTIPKEKIRLLKDKHEKKQLCQEVSRNLQEYSQNPRNKELNTVKNRPKKHNSNRVIIC